MEPFFTRGLWGLEMFSDLSLLTILDLAIAIPVCGHILLTKKSESVAVGWMALVLLSPFVGAALYGLFGINRITSYARRFRNLPPAAMPQLKGSAAPTGGASTEQERQLFHFAHAVHDFPFLPGNHVEPLINGDAAYPVMLAAIESAKISIALSVYIFDDDPSGRRFLDALIAAHRRGVAVYVLVDDVGRRYSKRAVDRELNRAGVACACFVPRRVKFLPFLNLRNHRKILVADGREAFIGGMNLRHGHVIAARPRHPVRDIHFRVSGPVIDQINAVFEQDWRFAARQDISLPTWSPAVMPPEPGRVLARIVADGPDDYFEKLQWIILGALAVCSKRVRVMTPYFLPNEIISSALMVAALRGVDVEVIVPARSNLPFMTWAMTARFQRLVEYGIKIYASPLPFDHSKVLVVDGQWSLVGSSNWDQRSLRLNFEVNLECYDPALGAQLEDYFTARQATATRVDLQALKSASLPVRLRNNLVGLFSPYL